MMSGLPAWTSATCLNWCDLDIGITNCHRKGTQIEMSDPAWACLSNAHNAVPLDANVLGDRQLRKYRSTLSWT